MSIVTWLLAGGLVGWAASYYMTNTRAEAIATMKRALGEFHISPIKTTIPLHLRIMDDEHFRSGDVDTGFVERVLLGK